MLGTGERRPSVTLCNNKDQTKRTKLRGEGGLLCVVLCVGKAIMHLPTTPMGKKLGPFIFAVTYRCKNYGVLF